MANNEQVGSLAEHDRKRADRKQQAVEAEQAKYTKGGMVVPRAARKGVAEVDLERDPTLAASTDLTEHYNGKNDKPSNEPLVNFGLGDRYFGAVGTSEGEQDKSDKSDKSGKAESRSGKSSEK